MEVYRMVKMQKLVFTLVLICGLVQFTPLLAMQQGQNPNDPGAAKQQPTEKSFKGKIEKNGEKYLLKTARASYDLDDQEKAKSFEGKDVKVTGTLDAATQTIHVTSIEPVA